MGSSESSTASELEMLDISDIKYTFRLLVRRLAEDWLFDRVRSWGNDRTGKQDPGMLQMHVKIDPIRITSPFQQVSLAERRRTNSDEQAFATFDMNNS
jgi:hypothetical protein